MSTILSDALPKPLKSWQGTFDLYQNPDGSFRAEFGAELVRLEWGLRWKLDPAERQLAGALIMLPGCLRESPAAFIVHVACQLNEVLGSDIAILANSDFSKELRRKARKRITKKLDRALDGLENKSRRKSHGSAITLEMNGGEKQLAWVVLEHARRLVETTQDLPTKGQVKQSVISAFPMAESVSTAQWASAFKEAGLAELQRIGVW